MEFQEFLTENTTLLRSSPEIIHFNERQATRELLTKFRGAMVGKTIMTTDDVGNNVENKVIKQDSYELIFSSKDENDNLKITLINKQKMTKRTFVIPKMGSVHLKRFI